MQRVMPVVNATGRMGPILCLISAMRSAWLEPFATLVLFTRTFWRG